MSHAARHTRSRVVVTVRVVATYLCIATSVLASREDPGPNEDAGIVALHVVPPHVRLDDAADVQRILVLAEDRGGVVRDMTHEASYDTGGLATFIDGQLEGARTGEGTLVVTLGTQRRAIPLEVRSLDAPRSVSYERDVLPTLTRAGCNQGACHGAATGKNGFALSLFGYDPERDHRALTYEWNGRRIDLLEPAESLLLLKPCRDVTHGGGKRIEQRTDAYRVLHDWIFEGASSDVGRLPRLVDLVVEPSRLVLSTRSAVARVPLIVRAIYEDGQDRDVTKLALLTSRDGAVAAIESLDTEPTIVAKSRGESIVLARFGNVAATGRVLVHEPESDGFVWPADLSQPTSLVDRHVERRLHALRTLPAGRCSDEIFVRRAFVDLVGMLPTVEETRGFLSNTAKDKRSRLVEDLVARSEFTDYLALEWAEALRIETGRLGDKGARAFDEWLRAQISARRPFDAVVRELLTATGSTFAVPAANLFVVERDPKLIAEHVAQAFLGLRLQCAQCHDHPFDRWTMDDYYGFAAFFARVNQKRGEDYRERIVYPRFSGEMEHARTGKPAAPKFLAGSLPTIDRNDDRRQVLSEWLTAKDNPWFAKNLANRLFARVFGRGLVEPVDDVRISNPPSHPELLDALAARLVELDWDVARFVVELCESEAYGRATLPAGARADSIAGRAPKRLEAEVLFEAIRELTGVRERPRGAAPASRASAFPAGVTLPRFLGLFGRSTRESACTCERSEAPNLAQVLHLLHGPEIEESLRSPKGRLAHLVAGSASDAELVDELFVAAYSRHATEAEQERIAAVIGDATGPARHALYADVLWAIINSKEFLFEQ
ncbi:MAG: DUF1549 domain-containing protein [Planctomycetes bacterium]|nr:DUF1549 domain-containing protein [Planctomycetota bacterium]MCB9917960.1 DUF1549 domain-containing protein [Planctomycetota bacterium]